MGEGETVRVEANPFLMQAFAAQPSRCESNLSAKQMFGGITKLDTWCKDGAELKEGACPK